MKILAVDDDPFVLELVRLFLLEAIPCDVTAIESPLKALDAVRAEGPVFDCLLLDISMPQLDGIELCRLVRAVPAYKRTPIIMLTAMTERGYVDRAFRAGATDYLTKPIDFTELQARLRSASEIATLLRETAAGTRPAAPADASSGREVPIAGVDGLLDYGALVNYLMQLSQGNLDGMQIVGVAVKRLEALHAEASADEFDQMLTDVASAVSLAFASLEGVLAYVGGGNFVVMFRRDTLEHSDAQERAVRMSLERSAPGRRNPALKDLDVAISNPVRPLPGSIGMVRKTLDRAIERARDKADR